MNLGSGSVRLAMVVSLAIAVAVVVAIVIIDPPTQRLRMLDERRLDDLIRIGKQVDIFWKRHEALPGDLNTLTHEPGFSTPILDPETEAPYGYENKDADSYRLCATFALDSGDDEQVRYDSRASEWAHPAGRYCFDLDVDKRDKEDR
jgi:hypothetical protein